jgi:hypothetical protein
MFALCSHAHVGLLPIVNYFKDNPYYDKAAEFEQGIKDVLSPYQIIKSSMEGNKQPLIQSSKSQSRKNQSQGKNPINLNQDPLVPRNCYDGKMKWQWIIVLVFFCSSLIF